MEWCVFKYEEDSNPYIAKIEKEKQKILKKYKHRVKKITDNYYVIEEV